MPCTVPTINLNGTDSETLINSHREAVNNLRKALTSLEACAPHGRDFIGPDACSRLFKAGIEHRDRYKAILDVLVEVQAIGETLVDQVDAGYGQ